MFLPPFLQVNLFNNFDRSAVVDFLQRTFVSPDVGICFVFCHKEGEKDQGSTLILRNILAQLIYRRREISYSTSSLYNFESLCTAKASSKAYQHAIRAEVNRFSKVFFVIDGLDTFSDKERLLNRLQKLPEHVQLFITLRDVKSRETIQYITASTPADDIRLYTLARIRQDATLAHLIAEDPSSCRFEKDIIRYVAERSHGVYVPSFTSFSFLFRKVCIVTDYFFRFLLAQLHIDLLASYNDKSLANSALSHLPESLDEAYGEAMQRVVSQNPHARRYVYWTLNAYRPLTVAELKSATNESSELSDDISSFEKKILTETCGLLTIDGVTGTVQLVHKTAKEFFTRVAAASDYFSNAQKEIAETCLTLLSADEVVDDCYSKCVDTPRSSSGSLLNYAATYWGYHAREAAEDEQTIQVLIMTFLNKLSWRRPLGKKTSMDGCDVPHELGLGKYPDGWTPLHNLAYFNVVNRAKRLIEQGIDVNAHEDCHGMTPLHCAAFQGNEEMVELLLDNGADIHAQMENGDTALHLATVKGHRKVMKLLLARKIDTRIKNQKGCSPLQVAVGTIDDEATVPLLVKNKVDVNAANASSGDTALHLAVEHKRPRILLFLLKNRANINTFNNRGLTPLHLAAKLNNCEALSLLLEHGAQVEARAPLGVTPLHTAALAGNWIAFDLLLTAGADINAWGTKGESLLHEQARNPSGMLVAAKLLDYGANIEARTSRGYTALQCAAMAGNKPMFFFFLSRGANVEVETPGSETLLHVTPPTDDDCLDILKYLLDYGLSVRTTSSQGWTPLHQTCFKGTGSPDIALDKTGEYIDLLLSHGADINAVSDSATGETALHLATMAGIPRPSLVTLLLARGALVDTETGTGKTALHLAAERGRESIFRILLDNGANASIEARSSKEVCMDNVSTTADHGGNDGGGATALDLAKRNPFARLWFDDEGNLRPATVTSRPISALTIIDDDLSSDEFEIDIGGSTLVGGDESSQTRSYHNSLLITASVGSSIPVSG
jgi:ankyrin repeat protein